MITLEIENEISEDKMKMVVDVLKALGISAVFSTPKDDTKLSRQQFIDKIELARKGNKTRVSLSEQEKILGL